MEKINWGIIGCGDVTEVKSGPAFNKVPHSSLVAVMRRNEEKVKDYASRHHVPKWYTSAAGLIDDPAVNAVYVATPPSFHEEYVLAALKAGKPVYVEKPMTTDTAAAERMAAAAAETGVKLCVAHYRRAQPLFLKIKQLIEEKAIGHIRFARMELCKQALTMEQLSSEKYGWRVDSAVSGGGLFHDLAPHQLDLMYYFFGEPDKANGVSINQSGHYAADDMVAGTVLFKNRIVFSGLWSFNAAPEEEKDICIITGEKGSIHFSVFGNRSITVVRNGARETITFDELPHVQQPMIQKVTDYFLGKETNPCSAEDGVKVMKLIDAFTTKTGSGHLV